MNKKLKPLFLWAGGKQIMHKHYKPFYPKDFENFVDPFVGAGWMTAKALELNPDAKVFINDSNKDLINIYKAIKSDWILFDKKLQDLYDNLTALPPIEVHPTARKDHWRSILKEYSYDYSKWTKTEEAAVLFFLLRTSFKGIWKTSNKTNRFTATPGFMNDSDIYGAGVYLIRYNNNRLRDNLLNWNTVLQNITIEDGDYKNCSGLHLDNAWVYLDPPYRGGTMGSYGQEWSESDQIELVDFLAKDNNPSRTIWISNRDIGDNFYQNYIAKQSYSHIDMHSFKSMFKLAPQRDINRKCIEVLLIKDTRK